MGWTSHAPIRIRYDVLLPVAPERVFAVLADGPGWPTWFKGMRRVRMDGPTDGAGTRRTVWVGPTRVTEEFILWEPASRLTLHIVDSSAPGLRVMAEDYQISAEGTGSRLTMTVGIDAREPLRHLPWLVRLVVGRLTSGVVGITSAFS